MQTLSFLHDYFSTLRFRGFQKFSQLFGAAYPDPTAIPLEDRLEFSLLVGDTAPFALRFGLFKIPDPETLLTIFRRADCGVKELEAVVAIMRPLTREYGLGVDWDATNPRLKAYFLRLQDLPNVSSNLRNRLPGLSRALGLERVRFVDDAPSCYLLGLDNFSDVRRNLKIYLRSSPPDREQIAQRLAQQEIHRRGLDAFFRSFSQDDVLDVTYSYKYSTTKETLAGFSFFFQLADNRDERVLDLVRTTVPSRAAEFEAAIDALGGSCSRVLFSHVGFTYSLSPASEQIAIYFSPRLEVRS